PADENPWIETHGCTRPYRQFRDGIRAYYRKNFPLTDAARNDLNLNPGGGGVSKISCQPKIALAVLEGMLAPHRHSPQLKLLLHHIPIRADVDGDTVRSVTLKNTTDNPDVTISADYILDASELGDLLPLTKTEYVSGAESQAETNEPHAPATANSDNVQG